MANADEIPALDEPDTTQTPSNTSATVEDENDTYHIKWIEWGDEKTAIITQNKNGPCPLLAIFNVLLLSKRILCYFDKLDAKWLITFTVVKLTTVLELISSSQIIDYIGSLMYEEIPADLTEEEKLNYEQNMSDAIGVFTKLQTGIDVNVQFKSVSSFECTSEITVFDVLRIPLYHGWLPDPQDQDTHSVLSPCSYNLIVDKIISSKDSTDDTTINEGLIAEDFLNSTASQLTCYGVVKILETMDDRQLGVFFRNNHFSTVYKRDNELFTLVTDQGFLSKPSIVWETLSSVQGDTSFTDSEFKSAPLESPDHGLTPEQQIDQDIQLAKALSLQEEELTAPHNQDFSTPTASTEETDRQMAERLQEEFNQQAASIEPRSGPSQQVNPRPAPSPEQRRPAPSREQQRQSNEARDEKCSIL